MQEEAPSSELEPAAHGMHGSPAVEYVPAKQTLHAVAPEASRVAMEPAAHGATPTASTPAGLEPALSGPW